MKGKTCIKQIQMCLILISWNCNSTIDVNKMNISVTVYAGLGSDYRQNER